jgi:CHAT domain-containing protein/tetratricopeptide (TPR) repeat protein
MLEKSKPIERELVGGEIHSYSFALNPNQYARVYVDQRGIGVVVKVFGQNGETIIESDINGTGQSEEVSLLADTATVFRLEIRAPDKNASKGRYEIEVKELRAATEEDKSFVAAEKLVAEATMVRYKQTAESRQNAIEKYQQSLPFWKSAKSPAGEAIALYMIASTYTELGEYEKAINACNQGLMLVQGTKYRRTEADLLDALGRTYNTMGDRRKSLEFFNRALPLRQAEGDRVGLVNTLNNIGIANSWMGDAPKALDYFNQAVAILKELGDLRNQASILGNMCITHSNVGEYKKAMDFCNQALSIKRALADTAGEATALNNIGTMYSNLGEYQQALDSYTGAFAIHKKLGERQGEAITLNNIGWVYATFGEYEKAINYYQQALEPLRNLGDKYGEATALSNIAVNYADMKDYKKALDINLQVLPLREAVSDAEGKAITLNNIASCYSNLGEKQKAIDYYNQALALHRIVNNPRHLISALRNTGAFHSKMGQYQKALDYFNEGLQLSRTIGDRKGEAGILAHIACLERDRGNFTEALSRIEEALVAVESLRINVKRHHLRASFLASVREYYELDIDLLMRLHKQRPSEGFDAAALQASEKGRARSLLELLAETRAEIREGTDPILVERERSLRQMISDKAERQVRLLSGKHTEAQATEAAKAIDELTDEYEQTQARIRQTSPRYAALMQPVPLSLKEIQTEVLDQETLLLEYALGEEKSFLWAVTPTSISSFELPKRAEIESAARRVYEILTARNKTVPNETLEQRRKRLEQAAAQYPKAAAALSQMLLGPVASEIKNKRLLIVGEGVLQYTSFAALPSPQMSSGNKETKNAAQETPNDYTPLIVDHEIVNLPSASVLAVLRRDSARPRKADRALAVFADPVFDSSDPRIGLARGSSMSTVKEATPASEVKRSAAESGLGDFVRLRFSRQEADEIARFASESKQLKAVDFAASRATAIASELKRYSILHFATHGLINNEHPELSGVVLSLVDEQGRPQDGFLRLYDIYNLKLDADLVVLSACQTALGKEIKGEGLVGLTRGFMYAGAPRVMASLWRIEDRATAEFMKRFYQSMLKDGLRPAAALREAQISMWKDKRWGSPYYWAAFTLQGEWKP